MSGALTAVKPRLATSAIRFEADAVALVLLGAAVAVLAAITWGTWGDLGRDTGYDWVAASRVADGQIPYVDFVYYYGPLAPFAAGLAAFLGGSGVGSFVALGLVLTVAIVVATYALARIQTGPVGAGIAAVATAAIAFSPTNNSFVVPHTYSETFAILLTLLFLLALARAADGSSGGLVAAGVAAGLVTLTRPEFAVAVAVAAVVWLVARRRTGRSSRADALRLLAPAVAVPVVVYGTFMGFVSPYRLFFENLYPLDTLRAGGSAIIRSQAPLTLHSFAVVAGYLVLYGAGAAALVLVSRRFAAARPKVWTSLVLGAAALALLVAAVNPEAIRSKLQWVFGGVPAAAALAVVVLVYRHVVKRRRLDAREQTLLATVTVLAVVAAKTYSGFFFLAERAQPAVYAAPFVFVALSRLHLVELGRTRTALVAGTAWLGVLALICAGLTVKDARAQSAAVSGRGGTVHVTPAEAPLYRAAVGAIESGTAPGEAMLVAPQLSGLYTLTGRTDPLREISLVPGALAKPADERAAIRALARVRFAITDRHSFGEYGQTRFGASFDRLLATWLRRNFDHAATLRPRGDVDHTLDVWVRRAP